MKPLLRQIDFLVFPFFDELAPSNKGGMKKYNQWLKQIESAGKREDTFFVVLRCNQVRNSLTKRLNKALKKHLKHRHAVLSSDSPYYANAVADKITKRFSVADKVIVRGFGQHAEHCVRHSLLYFVSKVGTRFPNTHFTRKEIHGLSIKLPTSYLTTRLHNPHPTSIMRSTGLYRESNKIIIMLRKKQISIGAIANALRRGKTPAERVSLMKKAGHGAPVVKKFRRNKK